MSIQSICIVGPGAIGGMMAVLLARAGYAVSALARPDRTQAIAAQGLTLRYGGETLTATPRVATDPSVLGPQDLVVVTVKGTGLRAVAPQLEALCKPETQVLFVLNGVPWWFLDGFGGPFAGHRLASLDPDGVLARSVPQARLVWGVINCVVSEAPDGAIQHLSMQQLQLGRPSDDPAGLAPIAEVFRAAGYTAEVVPRIRDAIWTKLQANVTLNPVSALAMATLDRIVGDPLTLELVLGIAQEARAVGAKLGLALGPDPAERLRQNAPQIGPSKTSMLQDAERGRPLELDGLVAAVVELGEIVGVPMPLTRAVLGLARVRSATLTAH